MIIDTHTHWPMNDCPGPDEMLELLDYLKTDYALVSGWEILFKLKRMEEYNTQLAQFCRDSGGRLFAMGTVHLAEGKAAIAEARRCIDELGMKGFKVHSWVQGETMFDPVMYDLCQLCAEKDVPIMFHDGTPPYAMSSQIGALAGMFPNTKLVLGHGGILHYWQEAMEVARQNSNVYITLCGSHCWAMQKICQNINPARILFGTDIIDGSSRDVAHYRCEQFKLIDISDSDRDLLSSKNAKTLYKLEI